MKKVNILLFLFCGFSVPSFSSEQIKFPYSRILFCEISSPCQNNSICEIEVSISINDWSDKVSPARGLVSWTQGLATAKEKEGWEYDDKLTMNAMVELTGSVFKIATLDDFPPPAVLTISNIEVGEKSVGKLQLGPTKFLNYDCRRYKDPK